MLRFARRAGSEVIVGLSWDALLVIGLIATLKFLGHYILRELLNPTDHTDSEGPSKAEVEQSLESQGVDEINRFSLAQRASHWVMAIATFALTLSGFIIMNNEVTVKIVAGLSWLTIYIVSSLVLWRRVETLTFWEPSQTSRSTGAWSRSSASSSMPSSRSPSLTWSAFVSDATRPT